MRPTTSTAAPPAAEALLQGVPRPRKHSDSHTAAAAAAAQSKDDRDRDHSPPIMYFLADEATVQAAAAAAASTSASMSSNGSSTFGVRSLEASVSDSELRGRRRTPPALKERTSFTTEDQQQQQQNKKQHAVLTKEGHNNSSGDGEHDRDRDRGRGRGREEDEGDEAPVDGDDGDDDDGDDDDEDDDELDARSMASLSTATQDFMSGAPSPKTSLSQPLTPMLGPSIAPSPAAGSPITPRSTCGREGEDSLVGAPQLIMPQIVIPSRRPFTDKGKRIGKLKMLIAGDSGQSQPQRIAPHLRPPSPFPACPAC